jgi:transketolase
MRVIPNMVVLVPCDAIEAEKATVAAAGNGKPTYIRLAREKTPVVTKPESPFAIGKANIMRTGGDAAIIACGSMVAQALLAASALADEGVRCTVVNCHTIKPLDEKTISEVSGQCGAVVTAEEHQMAGGLGSAVAELLAKGRPVPMEFVGVADRFGESGEPDELMKAFGLTADAIAAAARRAIQRKIKS